MPIDNGPVQAFDFEEWLRDGVRGVRQRMEYKRKRFDTSAFRQHIRNARKEQLLAVRSLVDSAIEFIGKEESKNKSA